MPTLTPDQLLRRRRTNRRILTWMVGPIGVVFLLLGILIHWMLLIGLALVGIAVMAHRTDPAILPS